MADDKYQLVDSIYGPGVVGGWLFTIASVGVTWFHHRELSIRDRITYDFIAVLILPAIAAIHLLHQYRHLPSPVGDVIRSSDPVISQYTAAIDAPLTVCDTFLVIPSLALCVPEYWPSGLGVRRWILLLFVGFLGWIAEIPVLTNAGPDEGFITTLTKEPLMGWYFFTAMAGSALFYLSGIFALCVFAAWLEVHEEFKSQHAETSGNRSLMPVRLMWRVLVRATTGFYQGRELWADPELRHIAHIAMMPMGLIMLFFCSGLVLKVKGVFVLVPKSSASLSNLDQAATFGGGIVTFCMSLYETYRSRRMLEAENTGDSEELEPLNANEDVRLDDLEAARERIAERLQVGEA